jgi:tryptophan synthase alpha chain
MSRIAGMFERLRANGRVGVGMFLTAGYPTLPESIDLLEALAAGGADFLEVGIPFSDPLAEGPTIQRSSHVAVEAGVSPADALAVVRQLRKRGVDAPILLMGYVNPIMSYDEAVFVRDAASAGADGLIVVDAPPEEAASLHEACRAGGLDLVFLLAPTSTDERIEAVARLASGFIYCVSVTGVTGARNELSADLADFIARVRAKTDLPLAIGFGVSRRDHVEQVGRLADAAIIGSGVINVIDSSPPDRRVEEVKGYAEVVSGRKESTTRGAGRG